MCRPFSGNFEKCWEIFREKIAKNGRKTAKTRRDPPGVSLKTHSSTVSQHLLKQFMKCWLRDAQF